MEMEPSFILPLTPMSTKQLSSSLSSLPNSQPRSPFMLPELDRLIASHLDQITLANASRVCRLWHSIFNPILWKQLTLQHVTADDDYDEDFNFIPRASPPSFLHSLPSSCSSTWSTMSMSSSSNIPSDSPPSPVTVPTPYYHNLTLLQQAFIHSSRNKVLKGLIRHGHLVQELKATGLTDQEMAVVAVLCPNLRVLELIGGRYNADDLTNLFQKRQDSIQVVRFRSCVQLRDIFQPLRYLSNLHEFGLYGSFVGNTITSPYFFERDLFPVLNSCPQLRSVLIEQVYIIDQEVNQGRCEGEWDTGGGDHVNFLLQDDSDYSSSVSSTLPVQPLVISPTNSLAPSGSILSAQLRSSSFLHGSSVRSSATQIYPTSLLKSLTLDCGDIPDAVIMALLSRCPMLEQLSLDWSRNLSDSSILRLQHICSQVTKISLARCEALTEDGFKALFKGYPNLLSVNLNGNVLSDSVLEDLSLSCRFLEELSINSCQNVSDLGIQSVLLNCAYLSYFSLRFVPGLSYLLFDDIVTTTASNANASSSSVPLQSGMLSTSPQFNFADYMHVPIPTSAPLPSSTLTIGRRLRLRPWACRRTLGSFHLPDLVQPNKAVLEKWRRQEMVLSSDSNSGFASAELVGDQLIQWRLQQITQLEHLTIGGNNLEMLVILEGLQTPREFKSLRITKLKRTLTLTDVQWLIEQAAPNLQRLALPVFGNRGAIEWIEEQRPGLMSFEK
ncbi:hypothetical protein BCR41DRAFT_348218 [Lobosporangium transversale]|uniref:F-box domain-containing protein n=1 Tax=Lobosporangium transversale TaxID=64571 RepID=A0A1Y2GVS8_9FUNG|nr:hypothetical protein BCR41DRAFT_348218 [Lobosporangium transversale]ORZ26398.1 hypothetical protein BCR41DRAFT_348218 [Lobosporangium transversale]|eukprot:XP_021884163.1 hypothetical protein BCR41DRAFT_348218 [Lobosporangium transversale]